MNSLYKTLLPVVIAACFSAGIAGAAGPGKRDADAIKLTRILVYSKTTGFRHDCIPSGKLALINMGKEHGFAVDTTENANAFTVENLKKYQVVVFLCTTHRVLDTVQKAAFAAWLHRGGGFVGIHAATDTEYGWPYYNKLVGAWFVGHPGPKNVRTGTLHVTDPKAIPTQDMPGEFVRTDEWYNFKDIQPDNHILVTIDQTTYDFGTDKQHPVSWTRSFDGARIFYTSMGHTKETYLEPLFLNHLWGGIRFVTGN